MKVRKVKPNLDILLEVHQLRKAFLYSQQRGIIYQSLTLPLQI